MFKGPSVAGWVVAGILGAVLFSGVVAFGPIPRDFDGREKTWERQAQAQKTKPRPTAQQRQPSAAKNEAYCKESKDPKDCILQLRATQANERQADYALVGLLLVFITIIVTAFGLVFIKQTLDATRAAVGESAKAAQAAGRQVEAATEANRLAAIAHAAERRPWVSVIAPRPGSAMTWDAHGARILVELAVKNVGKSPAFDVSVECKAIVMGGIDLNAALKTFCDEVRKRQLARTDRGEVLFPDEELPQGHHQLFVQADVDLAIQQMGINFFSPIVLLCVDYRSPLTGQRHTTGLILMVLLKPPAPGALPSLVPSDRGEIHMADLGVARYPTGSYAD